MTDMLTQSIPDYIDDLVHGRASHPLGAGGSFPTPPQKQAPVGTETYDKQILNGGES